MEVLNFKTAHNKSELPYKYVIPYHAPSSTHLHPASFKLHPPLWNTLNNIWTNILHVIGQFPQ